MGKRLRADVVQFISSFWLIYSSVLGKACTLGPDQLMASLVSNGKFGTPAFIDSPLCQGTRCS